MKRNIFGRGEVSEKWEHQHKVGRGKDMLHRINMEGRSSRCHNCDTYAAGYQNHCGCTLPQGKKEEDTGWMIGDAKVVGCDVGRDICKQYTPGLVMIVG